MTPKRIAEARTRRIVAPHTGGTVALPIAMTRKVLPQIATHPANAARSRAFEGEPGAGVMRTRGIVAPTPRAPKLGEAAEPCSRSWKGVGNSARLQNVVGLGIAA